MKYKVTIQIDTETGEYDMQFNNVTDPKKGIDYDHVTKLLYGVLHNFTARFEPEDPTPTSCRNN